MRLRAQLFYDPLLPRRRGDLFNRASSEKDFFTLERKRERECVCKEKKKDVRAGDNVRGRIRGIGIEEGRAILMLPVLERSFAYNVAGG